MSTASDHDLTPGDIEEREMWEEHTAERTKQMAEDRAATNVSGIPVRMDESVEPGAVELRDGEQVVGKIVNVGDAAIRSELTTERRDATSVQIREHNTFVADVDGYEVPYIEVGGENDQLHLILDNRFGIDTNREEIDRWLPFLANAMAVAAGRTSHGANSNIRNPHGEALAGYPTERIMGEPLAEVDA